ncbi:MAG: PrgI family protein [Defluviitaleaceae bacterium]|nr:PrgI family protein [Defluviitaleaceae bacterium]
MAYVSVPKDMTEVKTRLIMNLTKRQVVCFGAAAAIGVPLFLSFRGMLGNTGAMTLMIAAVIPAFFFAIYNKDGVIPAEKFLLLILRQTIFYPKIRVYRTKNMYAFIEKNAEKEQEGHFDQATGKTKNTNKGSPKAKQISATRRP